MPRVVGIDPGTLSLDVCGLEAGRLIVDRSIPTADALSDPSIVMGVLEELSPLDLIVGPSGYGLPLTAASAVTDADIRLACLSPRGESGGIGGLSSLLRALARSPHPVVFTPGVVHLVSVPAHRKLNRVDMGTADKVCAVALGVHEQASRQRRPAHDVSFVQLELGGAFTSAIAVHQGRIVDGLGGSSGPLGLRASGALDGEVAFLAERVTKDMVFRGGAVDAAGMPDGAIERFAESDMPDARMAWEAYLEGAVKAVAALALTVPDLGHVVLSGRLSGLSVVRDELSRRLAAVGRLPLSVEVLQGFAGVAKHAAQGAALIADGLAGGDAASLVDRLGIRQSSGTVLDHLRVISPETARRRLGIE